MISPTVHRSASVVFGHGLLPGLRPVRLRFGYAAERRRVDRKRIQDKDCFVITTRPPKRGKSTTDTLRRRAIILHLVKNSPM